MSMLARYSLPTSTLSASSGNAAARCRNSIEDDLGEEGLKRSIVVVATSSDWRCCVSRRRGVDDMAIAEYFRDQNKNVLCLMDFVMRW